MSAIEAHGGIVEYEYDGASFLKRILAEKIGADFVYPVVAVYSSYSVNADITTHIESLSELKSLKLAGPTVTDATMSRVCKIRSLRTLVLLLTNVTDDGLSHLKRLDQLTWLDMRGWNEHTITDSGLAHLARSVKLEHLDLSYNDITDRGLARLESLNGLRELVIRSTRITDRSVDTLENFKSLSFIDLRSTLVTEQGLLRLRRALPRAQILGDG